MDFDSVLNLQEEVFRDVFEYDEAPSAFAADDAVSGLPTFVEPTGTWAPVVTGTPDRDLTIAAAVRAESVPMASTSSRPVDDRYARTRSIALGVGRQHDKGSEHELVVLYQDRALRQDKLLARISDTARGEARVVYIGRARALGEHPWHRSRALDPLRLGASLAHAKVGAGTLGCFTVHRGTGAHGLLSNNHVLANVNSAADGDAVRQPGKLDGGKADNCVAALRDFAPIDWDVAVNNLDCAWAELDQGGRQIQRDELYDSAGILIGRLATTEPADAWPETLVLKVGRATGYTQGIVDAVNVNNLSIGYGSKRARFDGQIQIRSLSRTPFARPGDSGSLILTDGFAPLGLLFSGSSSGGFEKTGYAWANPIRNVLDRLELDILKGCGLDMMCL